MSHEGTMLEYAPRRPWVRRRWKRVVLVVLLMSVVTGGWWWRSGIAFAWQRFALLRAQQRCLDFQPDEGRVAYEEDPARAAEVMARQGGDYLSDKVSIPGGGANGGDDDRTVALWWPQVVREFPDAIRYTMHKGPAATLFLHERATPKGRRVLVCALVYLRDGRKDGQAMPVTMFEVRGVDPATWERQPGVAGGRVTVIDDLWNYYPNKPLRIYAGRADPADVSRFTMEYELAGQRGLIEGRVTDADDYDGTRMTLPTKVEMSVRAGGPRR